MSSKPDRGRAPWDKRRAPWLTTGKVLTDFFAAVEEHKKLPVNNYPVGSTDWKYQQMWDDAVGEELDYQVERMKRFLRLFRRLRIRNLVRQYRRNKMN